MMVFNSARTIYGILLQTALLTNKRYFPLINTTLNEKFNILPVYTIPIENYRYPKLNTIVIGIGGNPFIENNTTRLKRSKHSSKDGALFTHIPFALLKPNEDLDSIEKSKYRLRKEIEVNGQHYIAYYGKAIQENDIMYSNLIYEISKVGETHTVSVYDNLQNTILNPIEYTNLNLLNTDTKFITNICKVRFILTRSDINRIRSAISILHPNLENYMITEIGVCSGIDIENGNYTESVWTQINFFIDVTIDLQLLIDLNSQDDKIFMLELGGAEQLF